MTEIDSPELDYLYGSVTQFCAYRTGDLIFYENGGKATRRSWIS